MLEVRISPSISPDGVQSIRSDRFRGIGITMLPAEGMDASGRNQLISSPDRLISTASCETDQERWVLDRCESSTVLTLPTTLF